MFSSKELLVRLLKQQSEKFSNETERFEISENLRAALLIYGSTPVHMWHAVENLEWGSSIDENQEVERQGLAIKNQGVLLSELFLELIRDDRLKKIGKEKFPKMSEYDVDNALWIIFLLLRSFDWEAYFDQFDTISDSRFEEAKKFLEQYKEKLRDFRINPHNHI